MAVKGWAAKVATWTGEGSVALEVAALFRALVRDGIGVLTNSSNPEWSIEQHALPLDLRAFHSFTLQRAQVSCKKHTIEEEVAAFSRAPGVEFRAHVQPGHGFFRGGLWTPRELNDFACDAVIIFIAGFNDARYATERGGVEAVCGEIDAHVKWYKSYFGHPKLVLIEMTDGHGNELPWMTEYFRKLARMDHNILVERLEFPDEGWASEQYFKDTYHLTQEGLLNWLPTVKRFGIKVARKLNRGKVLFVTDSTFQAHNYQAAVEIGEGSLQVIVRTLTGDILRLKARAQDRVSALKEKLADAWHVKAFALRLIFHGCELEDWRTVASYHIRDGCTLLVRMCNEEAQGERYFVPDDLFYAAGHRCYKCLKAAPSVSRGGEAYEMPHNGEVKLALNVKGKFDDGNNRWLREDGSDGEWAVSFHGTGLNHGATMAEDGFILSRGLCGIYSSPQLEVAFEYAPTVEQHGTLYKVVVQNRINPGKIAKVPWWRSGELWIVPDEDDIRPYGLILREVSVVS